MFETNGIYNISFFSSVKSREPYQTENLTESSLCEILANPAHTKKENTKLLVGGIATVVDGKRTCVKRSLIVLDADHPKPDFLERATNILTYGDYSFNTSWGYYTSASATAEQPRYRIVIPLDTEIWSAETYRQISSAIMADIAPDDVAAKPVDREFDWSSAEFSRLMYMPTNPNGFYKYAWYTGSPLNVDTVLDWIYYWDYEKAFAVHGAKTAKKRGIASAATHTAKGVFSADDYIIEMPQDKDSIVGSFCKVFDVESAIKEYDLPYTQCGSRWIYDGSTSGIPGASISECGNFIFSSHESDPAGGRLQNAYDLVRLHLGLDNRNMYRLAMQSPRVKETETERARLYKNNKKGVKK